MTHQLRALGLFDLAHCSKNSAPIWLSGRMRAIGLKLNLLRIRSAVDHVDQH